MPIYLYWGDDDFAITKAIEVLRQSVLDPSWSSFNFDKILPDHPNSIISGLNQAMTPPFGFGHRFVWLVDTSLTQQCSAEELKELERTLPVIPEMTTLVLTSSNKPDGRLKSTKLLQQYAVVKEFSRIPPWQTEQLNQRVQELARDMNVNLVREGVELLAELVGNDTRLLHNELEKLSLYAGDRRQPLTLPEITNLVQSNTQNSLKLATGIKSGQTHQALELVAELIRHNEPGLKIVATLVSQFRTWLWIKILVQNRETDKQKMAKLAEIGNPNRVYFLQKEVQSLSVEQLQQTLPLLLNLEVSLKRGADELSTLQTHVIQLCRLFQK